MFLYFLILNVIYMLAEACEFSSWWFQRKFHSQRKTAIMTTNSIDVCLGEHRKILSERFYIEMGNHQLWQNFQRLNQQQTDSALQLKERDMKYVLLVALEERWWADGTVKDSSSAGQEPDA